MNRGCASFFISLLLIGFAQTATDAKPDKTGPVNKHSRANAESASNGQRNKPAAGQQRSQSKPPTARSKSPITDIVQVQPAVLAAPAQPETARSFSAPAGALYTSSDECG
jgi:hypothetical protein